MGGDIPSDSEIVKVFFYYFYVALNFIGRVGLNVPHTVPKTVIPVVMIMTNKKAKAVGVIVAGLSFSLLLHSCSEVGTVTPEDNRPLIGFAAPEISATKSTDIDGSNVNDYTFDAYAYLVPDNSAVPVELFYNTSGDPVDLKYESGEWNTWSGAASAKYFWPIQTQYNGSATPTASLSFFVCGPQSANATYTYISPDLALWGSGSLPALNYTIPAEVSNQIDLLASSDQGRTWSDRNTEEENRIKVQMKHLCSQVVLKVSLDENSSNKQIGLEKVKIGPLANKGVALFGDDNSITSSAASSDAISWEISPDVVLAGVADTVENTLVMVPQRIPSDATLEISFTTDVGDTEYTINKIVSLDECGVVEYQMGYRYVYELKVDVSGNMDVTVAVLPWSVINAFVNTDGDPTAWK